MIYPGSALKSLIIEFLAEKQFSSAKEVICAIKKTKMPNISFQAVYKQLSCLVSEGILEKHKHNYTFSLSYLRRVNKFNSKLIDAVTFLHDAHHEISLIDSGKILHYNCNTLKEIQSVSRVIEKQLLYHQQDIKSVVRYFQHFSCYFVSGERELMKQIKKVSHSETIVFGNTDIDRKACNLAQQENLQVNFSYDPLESENITEYAVYGDYVVEVKHKTQQYHEFARHLAEQNISSFPSAEYMHYNKYYYYPTEMAIYKDSECAMTVSKKIRSHLS